MSDTARPDGVVVHDARRATVAGAAMLAAVAMLTVLVAVNPAAPPLLFRVDVWWRGLVQPPTAWLRSWAETMRFLGAGWVMVPLRIGIAGWLAWRRRWWDLAIWLGAWALADVLTGILKPVVGRWRPDLDNPHSFPSAHAKTAAQVAVGIVLLLTPIGRRTWAWTVAVLWIVAMSFSRTVLDQHWLSDVLAGSLLGAGATFLVAGLVQRRRAVSRSSA